MADERCLGGVCKPLCSDDEQCGPGYVCNQRVCLAGCRSDSQCSENLACVNRQCRGIFNIIKIYFSTKCKCTTIYNK